MNAPDDSSGTWLDEPLDWLQKKDYALRDNEVLRDRTKVKQTILAHLQEREAAAELRERLIRAETNLATLQGLDAFIRWEKSDQLLVEIARRLKLAQSELLAVREGRA